MSLTVLCIVFYFERVVRQDGTSALIVAAGKGYLGCVRLLIDHGADKEAVDKVKYSS